MTRAKLIFDAVEKLADIHLEYKTGSHAKKPFELVLPNVLGLGPNAVDNNTHSGLRLSFFGHN